MAGKSPLGWVASSTKPLLRLVSSSPAFEYTALEMNDRSIGPAEYVSQWAPVRSPPPSTDLTSRFHATEVQPRKMSMQDMAGGSEIGGAEVETTNAKPLVIMEKEEPGTSSASLASFEGDEPTEEEKQTLRKVADKLPWSTFLVGLIELCERFTYYGLSGPFQNYIQNSYNDSSDIPGAIGMPLKLPSTLRLLMAKPTGLGQTGATGLTDVSNVVPHPRNHQYADTYDRQFFQFWCYVTPIMGAIVSDQYLGKYNTILYAAFVYLAGVLILVCTSLPVAIENGAALGGLIVAMIVIGIGTIDVVYSHSTKLTIYEGTGGIKSNVSPLIAEQYRGTRQKIRVLKTGERVIVDPAITIQRIYMVGASHRDPKTFWPTNKQARYSTCALMWALCLRLLQRRWRKTPDTGLLSSFVCVCSFLASSS